MHGAHITYKAQAGLQTSSRSVSIMESTERAAAPRGRHPKGIGPQTMPASRAALVSLSFTYRDPVGMPMKLLPHKRITCRVKGHHAGCSGWRSKTGYTVAI
eukprot:scaffold18755_cov20-Tisochrysis_lutea.AAC.2